MNRIVECDKYTVEVRSCVLTLCSSKRACENAHSVFLRPLVSPMSSRGTKSLLKAKFKNSYSASTSSISSYRAKPRHQSTAEIDTISYERSLRISITVTRKYLDKHIERLQSQEHCIVNIPILKVLRHIVLGSTERNLRKAIVQWKSFVKQKGIHFRTKKKTIASTAKGNHSHCQITSCSSYITWRN